MLNDRHNECSEWMLFCFPEIMSSFHVKFFFLANNFKQFAQTKLHVLSSTARVKCLMCQRLMGTLIGGVSNIFRGKNHTTKIVSFLDWGNFVLYERALLLLFLLHCRWMRVNVSKYQVHQPIKIAFQIERSILMLFCVPNLMSVFLRKIFLLEILFRIIFET